MKISRSSGFGLLGVLVAMAVVLVLLAAMAPSTIRLMQVNNEVGAAQQLSAISTADFAYAKSYGSFVPPKNLVGNLANSALLPCQNPWGLLQGMQSTAPPGYSLTWIPGITATTPPCVGVTGYTSFQIALDPISRLEATRHFLYSSATSQIYFTSENRAATPSDAIYQVMSIGGSGATGNGTGNNNNNAGTSNAVTVWNSTSIPMGDSVLRATSIGGDTCTASGSSGGYTGVYISLVADNTSDPCQNTGQGANSWFCTCGIPTWSAAPPPGLSGSFTNVQATAGGACVGTGNSLSQAGFCAQLPVNIPGSISAVSFHTFSFSLSTPNSNGYLLYAEVMDLNNQTSMYCTISPNGNVSSCSNTGTLSISPGDQNAIFIGLQFPGGDAPTANWSGASYAIH